ncbi:MAG: hypothetical protein M1838_005540 [Thelocarpon superellum]|nr:MAG: hypothetical protein M1838_005540 [Thelocarpon superellum]
MASQALAAPASNRLVARQTAGPPVSCTYQTNLNGNALDTYAVSLGYQADPSQVCATFWSSMQSHLLAVSGAVYGCSDSYGFMTLDYTEAQFGLVQAQQAQVEQVIADVTGSSVACVEGIV